MRAALRAVTRATDHGGRDIAHDIVDAAWDLVFNAEVTDFTVKQVAARANVALQTFYRHFGSKDELLLAMFEDAIYQGSQSFIAEGAGRPPVDRLRHLVTAPLLLHYDERARRVNRWRLRERQRLLEAFPDAVEAIFEPYRAAIVHAIVAVCDSGSHGSIPKSSPRIDRAAVSAPARPRLMPTPTTHATWRTTSVNT